MTEDRYRSEVLGKHHDRKSFSCGVEELDRYFYQQAGQDQRRGVAVPYVFTAIATGVLVGYYTLSALSIVSANLPAELAAKLPRYDVLPAILLGRLAVDRRYSRQGIGKLLLLDALDRSLTVSRDVGALAVVVQARDDAASAFYVHHGFLPFEDHKSRLFIPMSTVAKLGI